MTTRIGSTLDSLLAETGELEEVNLRAQEESGGGCGPREDADSPLDEVDAG